MELVPREWWPSAFSGLIAREVHEKIALARYLQNILHAQVQGDAALDARFDLTEESLIPTIDLPLVCDGMSASLGFLPTRCHFNEVEPIFDPIEAFQILRLDGTEKEISTAIHAIEQYTVDMVVPLRCAVHPYTDCVLVTALLFALRNKIRDGKMLNFTAEDWADLPDNLAGNNPYDLTYMSSSWKDWPNAVYEFREIKTSVSKGRILFNADAYNRAKADRNSRKPGVPCEAMKGVNFNGDFDPKKDYYTLYFQDNQVKQVPVQLYGLRSDMDYEAKMIVALANGTLRQDAVVPSLQGYLWAADCGFLQSPDGTTGTVLTREVEASKGAVGYGAKRISKAGNAAQKRADFVLTALMDLQTLAIQRIHDRLDEDREGYARRIMGFLKGPIVFARKYDSGILSRIPAELALSAALPGAALFEKEFAYTPPWWSALNTGSTNTGKAGPNKKGQTSETGGLRRV